MGLVLDTATKVTSLGISFKIAIVFSAILIFIPPLKEHNNLL